MSEELIPDFQQEDLENSDRTQAIRALVDRVREAFPRRFVALDLALEDAADVHQLLMAAQMIRDLILESAAFLEGEMIASTIREEILKRLFRSPILSILQMTQELELGVALRKSIIRPEHVAHLGISKEGWINFK